MLLRTAFAICMNYNNAFEQKSSIETPNSDEEWIAISAVTYHKPINHLADHLILYSSGNIYPPLDELWWRKKSAKLVIHHSIGTINYIPLVCQTEKIELNQYEGNLVLQLFSLFSSPVPTQPQHQTDHETIYGGKGHAAEEKMLELREK